MIPKWKYLCLSMIITLQYIISINCNFPTLLPNYKATIYQEKSYQRYVFETDIITTGEQNEITLKNIKRILSGMDSIDVTMVQSILNDIINVLKNISNQIKQLISNGSEVDHKSIPVQTTIIYPSVSKNLNFYATLTSGMALLQQKNHNFMKSNNIDKRDVMFLHLVIPPLQN